MSQNGEIIPTIDMVSYEPEGLAEYQSQVEEAIKQAGSLSGEEVDR